MNTDSKGVIDTPRFRFQLAPIQGLWQVDRKPLADNRGAFTRFYCADEFAAIGVSSSLVQINHSQSVHAGTLRGLHFQHKPHAETKVVTCVKGRIFDVAVDLRAGSPTFLHWHGVELTADNKRSLVIPPGFAHGFQSLEPDSEVMYLVTAAYSAQFEDGLNPLDPAVGVAWPLPPGEMSMRDTERDFIDPAAYAGLAGMGEGDE